MRLTYRRFTKNKELSLVVNTVGGASSQDDSAPIRKASVFGGIPYFTTIQAARASPPGIEAMKKTSMEVRCLQEYHSAMPMVDLDGRAR